MKSNQEINLCDINLVGFGGEIDWNEEKFDNETISCIEVAADMSGAKLPENWKEMTFNQFFDAIKFESKEQEDEFLTYYYK